MKLTRRVEKLEDTAKAMYEDNGKDSEWLRKLPTPWLEAMCREISVLQKRPEVECCLWLIDESSPKEGPLNYQVSVPGEKDFDEFVSDPGKKIAEYPEHFKIFTMSLRSDY